MPDGKNVRVFAHRLAPHGERVWDTGEGREGAGHPPSSFLPSFTRLARGVRFSWARRSRERACARARRARARCAHRGRVGAGGDGPPPKGRVASSGACCGAQG